MPIDEIVGYMTGGYAWCPTCIEEGAALAHRDEPLMTLRFSDQVEDDAFCDGCGALVLRARPCLEPEPAEMELGSPGD
jgi:hypothetical protein